jgi:hypothetical protein
MKWPTDKLVAAQFFFYTIGSIAAFFSWFLVLTDGVPLLQAVAGDYLTGHFTRWTTRFFFWGPAVLSSGLLALASAYLILQERKIGGFLGIAAFLIGYAVDIIVANVMFVHVFAGLLIGWILLSPLLVGWDEIFSHPTT